MGNKIVEIEEGWKLGYALDNVVVNFENKKIKIPISDINLLMINNISCLLSTRLLCELSSKNILIILCNDKHLPQNYILPISGNYNSLKKIQWQYGWTSEYKTIVWTQIVKLKIQSQINFLSFLKEDIKEFDILYNQIQSGDYTNREAVVAKKYFQIIFGVTFERHNDTNETNQYINAFLNYGYTILLGIVARSILKNGLDTRLAVFHRSFSNHTALASDFMEPFRVIVDKCVYRLIREIKETKIFLTSDIKHKLIDVFSKQIIYNNERMIIFNCIDKFTSDILEENKKIKIEYIYDQY